MLLLFLNDDHPCGQDAPATEQRFLELKLTIEPEICWQSVVEWEPPFNIVGHG